MEINKQLYTFLRLSLDFCHWKYRDVLTAPGKSLSDGVESEKGIIHILQYGLEIHNLLNCLQSQTG